MEALHQTSSTLESGNFPVQVFKTDVQEIPPHWHKWIEIVYVLGNELKIGLNNCVYTLKKRDILLVGMGEVHYFLAQPQKCDRIILNFELSLFDDLSNHISKRKITNPFISYNESNSDTTFSTYKFFEKQILSIYKEVQNKESGYEFTVGARIYDIAAGILRYIPNEKLCSSEMNKQLKKLEILEQVTRYIDANFREELSLAEVSKAANFSMYHFTRFFKDTTGMTLGQYFKNYKVSKAVNMLMNTNASISEIAFDSGFNSIKTFNRVFKQVKGCSPSEFKKAIFE